MKKTANQIREEVRKQLAAKYKQEVEYWKDRTSYHSNLRREAQKKANVLEEENEKLKEEVRLLKEWNERLMEFMDMPDEVRSKNIKEYVDKGKKSEEFKALFSPYFNLLNRLSLLGM